MATLKATAKVVELHPEKADQRSDKKWASAPLIRTSGYCVAASINHEKRTPKKAKAPRA